MIPVEETQRITKEAQDALDKEELENLLTSIGNMIVDHASRAKTTCYLFILQRPKEHIIEVIKNSKNKDIKYFLLQFVVLNLDSIKQVLGLHGIGHGIGKNILPT